MDNFIFNSNLIHNSFININWKKNLKRIILAFSFLIVLRMLVADLYYVPTGSMEYTLKSRSYILVSKLHYGAVLPKTTYEIPYISKVLKMVKPIKLFNNVRFFGFSKINRNDMIVAINGNHKIAKRVVAIPKDTLQIKMGQLIINSIKEKMINLYKYKYTIKLGKDKIDTVKDEVESMTYMGGDMFEITSTGKMFKKMKAENKFFRLSNEDSIHRKIIFPKLLQNKWDKNNYGPIVIPYKGMKIEFNSDNFALYRDTINLYEGIAIDEEYVTNMSDNYVFKKNYVFVMGDNRMESIDSRYIGFVPVDNVLGKIVY